MIKTKMVRTGVYDFTFKGNYFLIALEKGKWTIKETESNIDFEEFSKKKDLLNYIESYFDPVEEPEEAKTINTWAGPDPQFLLILALQELERGPTEIEIKCLDRFGLVPEGNLDIEVAYRHKNLWETYYEGDKNEIDTKTSSRETENNNG